MISDKELPALAEKLAHYMAKRKWQTGTLSQRVTTVGIHDLDAAHSGALPWSRINKTGSALADLASRAHSALTGLDADDHAQYVHTATARTITASHNFAHATVGFTSPAADSYFNLGQARIGYDGFHDGDATFAHRSYSNSEEYSLRQEWASGNTIINAVTQTSFRILDFDVARLSANLIEFDNTAAATLKSEHYASQTTGWALTYSGALDVRYLYADEMHVKAFIADLEQALAGGQIICKSVAKLAVDFLVPNYSGTTLITVESFPGFPNAYVFSTGDTIGIKIVSRTNGTAGSPGSLVIGWVFGTVSSPSINSTDKTQVWLLTRLSSTPINGFAAGGTASAGTAVEAGAIVLDFGVSGNGYYEVNAIDGQMAVNSPYMRIYTWAAHPIYDRTVRTSVGNLTGLGFSGQYGLYALGANANQYIVASGSGITVRNTTISQYDGSNNLRGQWDTLTGIDLKALGDISWGLTAGLHDMSISALQNYSFSDTGTIFGGVAAGKGATRDRVVLYNQQYDVDKEAHVVVDARFIDSNNPNTYNRTARVTIATSRWFPGMGVQHSAYIELASANGNVDNIVLIADAIGAGATSPAAKFNIYEDQESTTQTNFTQAISRSGLLITTDFTDGAYTPGIFWSTQNNNATKPKAGIYTRVTNSEGSYLYIGTSSGYSTGITNNALVINPFGSVGINAEPTISDGQGVDVNGKILRLRTSKTPIGAGASGNAGEICWDASYIYVCTGTNTWRRVAHSTW